MAIDVATKTNMDKQTKHRVGNVLVRLIGVVLVLAGVLKLVNFGADDMLEGLAKAQLIQHKTLISCLAIGCGILLLVPRTTHLGLLMSTAYWGGAIVAHMTYNDSVVMPAVFLSVTWLGHWLCLGREPD